MITGTLLTTPTLLYLCYLYCSNELNLFINNYKIVGEPIRGNYAKPLEVSLEYYECPAIIIINPTRPSFNNRSPTCVILIRLFNYNSATSIVGAILNLLQPNI